MAITSHFPVKSGNNSTQHLGGKSPTVFLTCRAENNLIRQMDHARLYKQVNTATNWTELDHSNEHKWSTLFETEAGSISVPNESHMSDVGPCTRNTTVKSTR